MSADELTLRVYQQTFKIMLAALKRIGDAGGPTSEFARLAIGDVQDTVARARLGQLVDDIKAGCLKEDPAQRGHLRIIK